MMKFLFWRLHPYAWFRNFFFKRLHRRVNRRLYNEEHLCFNYGYIDDVTEAEPLELHPKLDIIRHNLQLYHHLVRDVEMAGKDVLEVGCFRGVGLLFVHQYKQTRSATGVDLQPDAVDFCIKQHGQNGLRFEVGSAEALPFEGGSFDTVINVESSHCYGSMEAFLGEVARILRPGGYFLFTDYRHGDESDVLQRQLRQSGLSVEAMNDITRQVMKAIEADQNGMAHLVNTATPMWLRRIFRRFASDGRESEIWQRMNTGKTQYMSAIMQKAAA